MELVQVRQRQVECLEWRRYAHRLTLLRASLKPASHLGAPFLPGRCCYRISSVADPFNEQALTEEYHLSLIAFSGEEAREIRHQRMAGQKIPELCLLANGPLTVLGGS